MCDVDVVIGSDVVAVIDYGGRCGDIGVGVVVVIIAVGCVVGDVCGVDVVGVCVVVGVVH